MKDEVKATLAAASGGSARARWIVKSDAKFKVGDMVRPVRVPPALHDAAGLGTPQIFERVVGKTLRIDGFDEHGNLELNVLDDGSQAPDYTHHTIWIEPEFVEGAS